MLEPSTKIYFFKDDKRPYMGRKNNIVNTIESISIDNAHKNNEENRKNGDLDRYNILGYEPKSKRYYKTFLIKINIEEDKTWQITTRNKRTIICSPTTQFLMPDQLNPFNSIIEKSLRKGDSIYVFDVNEICVKLDKIEKIKKVCKEQTKLYEAVVFGDVYIANEFIVRSSKITRIETL